MACIGLSDFTYLSHSNEGLEVNTFVGAACERVMLNCCTSSIILHANGIDSALNMAALICDISRTGFHVFT